MRKIKALPIISTVVLLLALTSCLNNYEGENYIECGRDIGFITTNNGIKCAATSYGYITSSEIKSLKMNECYYLGYQITELPVDGVYNANKVFHVSENPLAQTELKIGKQSDSLSVAVKDLRVPFFSSSEYLDDRWVFDYTALTRNNEKVIANFYFDKDNQIDKYGNNIKGKNKLIIDVYFTKDVTTDSSIVAREKQFSSVGNLKSLRTFAFTPEYSSEVSRGDKGSMYMAVLVQFRYHKYISANKSEIAYLGSWDSVTSQKPFYIVVYYYTSDTGK